MNRIAFVAALLLTPMGTHSVFAQNVSSPRLAEKTGVNAMLNRQPTGSDVLMGIHQFDLFEQAANESAQQRGDNGLREFSSSHSQAAEKQDKELATISQKAGLNIEFPEKSDATAIGQLAGLEGSVGPAFVREYYAAQTSEYDAVVSSLKRYLEKPDQNDLKAYAAKQLPVFVAGQKSATENWDRAKQ